MIREAKKNLYFECKPIMAKDKDEHEDMKTSILAPLLLLVIFVLVIVFAVSRVNADSKAISQMQQPAQRPNMPAVMQPNTTQQTRRQPPPLLQAQESSRAETQMRVKSLFDISRTIN